MTLHKFPIHDADAARIDPAGEFIILAHSATIGFDNIDTTPDGYTAVPDGYRGFTWSNFSVVNAGHLYPGDTRTGFHTGITSGEQVAFNRAANPADVALPGGSFTLKSVELTAGWDSRLKVEIVGYRDGAAIYDKTVSIVDQGPTLVELNFKDVDDVRFIPKHGKHDPAQQGGGDLIAFDDFVFGKIRGAPAGASDADTAKLAATLAGWSEGMNHHAPFEMPHMIHPVV